MSRGIGDPVALHQTLSISVLDGDINGDAGASFFLWLLADLAKERIAELIDAGSGCVTMTDDECSRALAAAAAKRLDLERQEEALIELAASEGRSLGRRRDIDPRAFLGIEA